MNKTVALFLLVIPLLLSGCHKAAGDITPADKQAQSDPNSKGAELLKTYLSLDTDERSAWLQQHSFDLKVFEQVNDPKLKAQYESEIKPHIQNK